MFYNSSDSFEFNECVSHGACSISPNMNLMQEIMFILLRQIAYYLLKLKDFNVEYKNIVYDIMFQVAFAESLKDLSETQILETFSHFYSNLVKVRKKYLSECKNHEIGCRDLKNVLKFSAKTSLSDILKRGNKEFLQKYKKYKLSEKYNSEILSSVIKSVCVNWINLHDYNRINNNVTIAVLNALNIFNFSNITSRKLKNYTDIIAKYDIELLKEINKLQIEKFGKIQKTTVSTSTRPNKAILVSGSNLNDLKYLLDSLDEDIDVYTNGNLLVAHAYPLFKKYPRLKGHFGSGTLSTILDFATFPGAIFLTRNETQNIEYLYRGRLFTTDKVVAKGVVKLDGNDFIPLINSALQAKGFAKGQVRTPEIVGFDDEELSASLDKLLEKRPEKIFIVGLSNLSIDKLDYFKKFFWNMPKNTCAISFSYNPEMENVIHIDIGNDYFLLYNALQIVFEKIPINSEKLVFFLTKCDVNSLSNMINLKNKGAKDIFLSDCPPLVINPAVLRAFTKLYNINEITTPKEDLKKINLE